jgi:hypothetical protein
MRKGAGTTQGRHRAKKAARTRRGLAGARAAASAVGMAGVTVAAIAAVGTAPTMSASPQLLATVHYLRGTTNGHQATQQEYEHFIDETLAGAGVEGGPYKQVPYNAGFRPFSQGFFSDLTFDDSVAEGVTNLGKAQPAPGDVIFGYSQGAVVASQYKGSHSGNTYVLVANPNKANGGILQRFEGLHIPLLDVTFTGATPNNGDATIDVARQYDGWADFPTYLFNPLAVANAVMGMVLVHGNTQFVLTEDDLKAARDSGNPDYYQVDEDSKTTYYVIRTYPIPLLMPLDPFLPAPVIAALDAPLRKIIESGYDRSDYAEPTRATLFPRRQVATTEEPAEEPTQKLAEKIADKQANTPQTEASESDDPPAERTTWRPGKRLLDELRDDISSRRGKATTDKKSADTADTDTKHDADDDSAATHDTPKTPERTAAGEATGGGSSGEGAAA